MLDAEFLNEAVLGGTACTGKSGRVLVDVFIASCEFSQFPHLGY